MPADASERLSGHDEIFTILVHKRKVIRSIPVKYYLFITSCLLTIFGYGQKFMINRVKDTVAYTSPYTIDKETGDTSYAYNSDRFEKINGEIMNRIDKDGIKRGPWILIDNEGNIEKGNFKNGHRRGVWQLFNKDGTLLQEKETVTFNKKIYTVKEVNYTNGRAEVKVYKPFLGFLLKKLIWIIGLLFIAFLVKIYINNQIYNIENETDFVPIFLLSPGNLSKNIKHSLYSIFTWWFLHYKKENKFLVRISNLISVFIVTVIIAIIIGFLRD
ncbi:MAG TPA: hypothetical protein VFF27_05160 [Bacteroidia bacterium]|nr:hypothetical protein [Bacteroidia bacterium]